MRRVLVLFTSSYPFGSGETFVGTEIPFLRAAFDHTIIVSNDTSSEPGHAVPPGLEVLREPYALTRSETLRSLSGPLSREVRAELAFVRRHYGVALSRAALATVLVTWTKARKFARLLRSLARRHPGAEIHAYAYWADDMAVAAAYARSRGWVRRAWARAHGWDVYFDRSPVGFLPFRRYLAEHLDHLLFVSRHGLEHFRSRTGLTGPVGSPALGCSRLGTPALTDSPLGRRAPFVVLSCSALGPVKRVGLIARALAHVSSEVRWIHVGDGPSRMAVEAACRSLPAHVRVDLLGALPHERALALYREVRPTVFVNASASEGVPVSIMEALSAGVPVVATAVGGTPEIVRDGENGTLLSPDVEPPALAAALERFARLSDDEYGALAAAAWRTWREELDAARNYPAFLRLVLGEDGGDP